MAAIIKHDPISVPDPDSAALHALEALLGQSTEGCVTLTAPNGEPMTMPVEAQRLLAAVVHELVLGNAVTIAPVHTELTTQEAADLLNVSRPFLVKLLESGTIPFHRVGTHRRIRRPDMLAYMRTRSESRRAALAAMAREAQELDLYE